MGGRRTAVAVVVLLAVAGAACGGGEPADTPPETPAAELIADFVASLVDHIARTHADDGVPKVGVLLEDAWSISAVCRVRSRDPTFGPREDLGLFLVRNGWAVAVTTLLNERALIGGGGADPTIGVASLLALARREQNRVDGHLFDRRALPESQNPV